MKKIAILTCLEATRVCSGAACFSALNQRTAFFQPYVETEVEVLGFFHCNGCKDPIFDGMDYKFEQLKRSGVETLHMARCIEVECHRYNEMKLALETKGFSVVKGSHR